MEYYSAIRAIYLAESPEIKFRLFAELEDAITHNVDVVRYDPASAIGSVLPHSCAAFCRIVDPVDVPLRTRLDTQDGRIRLMHAIAHIEYSAIDLALDACYRFRDVPDEFRYDWMEVAREEIEHFEMVRLLLRELGSDYGELPVHVSLLEAAERTPDLISRMAVVPRYLEANGLDANPRIMAKLEMLQDPWSARALEALKTILRDEIDHVRKGNIWFLYECNRRGEDPSVFFHILERVLPGSTRKRGYVNADARLAAGFRCDEINRFAKARVCEER